MDAPDADLITWQQVAGIPDGPSWATDRLE